MSDSQRSLDYQDVMDAFTHLNEPLVRELQEVKQKIEKSASKDDVESVRRDIARLEERTYSSQVIDLKLGSIQSALTTHITQAKDTEIEHKTALKNLGDTVKTLHETQTTLLKRWFIGGGAAITVIYSAYLLLHNAFHLFQ